MTLSQCRVRLRQLIQEQTRLLAVFLARKTLVKGGIYESKSRCGKPNCRCAREGIMHVIWKLYWTEGGKTRQQAIKKGMVYDYRRLTANYQRFRHARAQLVKIHRAMMVLVNQLEKGMTKSSVKAYWHRWS